jgi:uncharacterized circularly permuted ATP-grasp superfamily protein
LCRHTVTDDFEGDCVAAFDEMWARAGAARLAYGQLSAWLARTPVEILAAKREEAERLFRRIGITFAVYT